MFSTRERRESMTKKTITAFALLTVLSCLFRPTNCVTSASMAEQQGDTANRELRHRRKRGGSGRKRRRRHRKRAHWGHGRCEFALPRVRYVSPTECHPYRITTTNDFCSSTKKGNDWKNYRRSKGGGKWDSSNSWSWSHDWDWSNR